MGIEFAPLNIPIARRLQTLAAAFWIVSFGFGNLICAALSLYIFIFTRYWVLGMVYLAWAYYDRDTPYNGGRKWCYFKSLPLWKYFVDYFPIRLVKTTDLPADKNYLFCAYPHGILSAGIFGNFGTSYSSAKKLFPGLTFHGATLDLHFKVPIFREFVLALGGVSASKEGICGIIGSEKKGNVCNLIVGGAAESFHARRGTNRIILTKRKGFIKVALQVGCPVVPVFSFGETDLYDQVTAEPGTTLHKIQSWIKNQTGVAPCIVKGRGLFQYSFGIVPHRAQITTVVGAPIDLPKISNPSPEEVDKYHTLYKERLVQLFNEHKTKYLSEPEKAELIIE